MIASLLGSCKQKYSGNTVKNIIIYRQLGKTALDFDQDRAKKWLRQAIEESNYFQVDEKNGKYNLTLRINCQKITEGKVPALPPLSKKSKKSSIQDTLIAGTIKIKSRSSGFESFSTSFLSTFNLKKDDLKTILSQNLEKNLKELGRQIELSHVQSQKLIEIIQDEKVKNDVILAIRYLGERKDKGAVKIMLNLLKKEEFTLPTIGALSAIGDEQAVPSLIKLTNKKGIMWLSQIYFAISAIGGIEAEAFLSTTANGHPSKQARILAWEALNQLQKAKYIDK